MILALFVSFSLLKCIVASEFYLPLGCYHEDDTDPDLANDVDLTLLYSNDCSEKCSLEGYPYSGLQSGSACVCGSSYGQHGMSSFCNFTCPLSDDSSDVSSQCGGPSANTVHYAVDVDPLKRIQREDRAYTEPLSFDEARKLCVIADGDLVVLLDKPHLKEVANMTDNTAGASDEVWIGYYKRSSGTKYAWVNPTIKGMDLSGEWGAAGVPSADDVPAGEAMCVVMHTGTLLLNIRSCQIARSFVCTQIPPPTTMVTPTDDGTSDDGEEEVADIDQRLVLYVVLPLFFLLYGGSCIFYIIGKSCTSFKRKQIQKQREAATLGPDSDTRPLTSRDITLQSKSPPPYYRATSRGKKVDTEPLVQKPVPHSKHYKHEDEEPANAHHQIDLSKLPIKDIIYIKSLMGDRRPATKKRKILVA